MINFQKDSYQTNLIELKGTVIEKHLMERIFSRGKQTKIQQQSNEFYSDHELLNDHRCLFPQESYL